MAVERTRTTAQATAEGLRVFVAGIPWKLGEDTLRRDFEECGVIEDLFLLRDQDGNSQGRGYITFREQAAAQAALKYDKTEYGGRKVFVQIAAARKRDGSKEQSAKPAKQAKPASATDKEFPAAKPEGCRSLCLKNIGEATDADITAFLDGCPLQSIRVVQDRQTGKPRGIAFVDFKNESGVDTAMERNGQDLNGQKVEMHYEAPRERPRPEGCLAVAIKKLPPDTQEIDLRKLCRGLKSIKEVRVIRDAKQKCTGLGFVEFSKPRDVERAVQRDGMKVKDQVVFICYETKEKKRPDWVEKRKQTKSKKDTKRAEDEEDEDEEQEEDAETAAKEAKSKKQKAKKKKKEAETPASQDQDPRSKGESSAEADGAKPNQGTKRKLLEKGKKKKKTKVKKDDTAAGGADQVAEAKTKKLVKGGSVKSKKKRKAP